MLTADNLAAGYKVHDVSFSIRRGEIAGFAGLLGSGRTETARLVFGADPMQSGVLTLDGQAVRPREPIEAIKAGIGFSSEDRKLEGIVPEMSVSENLTLALMPQLTRAGIVDDAKQRAVVEKFIKRLGVKCSGPDQKIRELSGGTQQKVLLARWLAMNPKLLILDEPTRGIDVGAKAEIQSLIKELADQGLAVPDDFFRARRSARRLRSGFRASRGAQCRRISPRRSERKRGDDRDGAWRQRSCLRGERVLSQAPAQVPAAAVAPRRIDTYAAMVRYSTLAALVALILFNFAYTNNFISWRVLDVNLTQVAAIVIVGVGMTLVIATGGIDLSVGSLMAISGAIAPIIFLNKIFTIGEIHVAVGVAMIGGILLAGAFGWFNGWLITRFRIQPIIATLVLFIAGRGIAQVMTNGNLQPFKLDTFQWIGLGRLFAPASAAPGEFHGVPDQVAIMVVLVALAAWVLKRSLFGRQILAIGGNERAARLAGVPVARVKRWVYFISGLCAGVAGLVVIAINSSSDANQVGLGMELDAIAAVAVGGTLLSGGRATITGTLIGALIIQLVRYTLLANGVPDDVAKLVKAALIIAAVWLQGRGRT